MSANSASWSWSVSPQKGVMYDNYFHTYNTHVSSNWWHKYWNHLVYPNTWDGNKLYKYKYGEHNNLNWGHDAFVNNSMDRALSNYTALYPIMISGDKSYNWNNYIVANIDNIYFVPASTYYTDGWNLKPFLDTNWSKRLDKIVWWDMNWNSNSSNATAWTLNLTDSYQYAHSGRSQSDQWEHSWRFWWNSGSWCNANADINLEWKFWPQLGACWIFQWWGWYKFFPLY